MKCFSVQFKKNKLCNTPAYAHTSKNYILYDILNAQKIKMKIPNLGMHGISM